MSEFIQALNAVMATGPITQLAAAARTGLPRTTLRRLLDFGEVPDLASARLLCRKLSPDPAHQRRLLLAYLDDVLAKIDLPVLGITIAEAGQLHAGAVLVPAEMQAGFAALATAARDEPGLRAILEELAELYLRVAAGGQDAARIHDLHALPDARPASKVAENPAAYRPKKEPDLLSPSGDATG